MSSSATVRSSGGDADVAGRHPAVLGAVERSQAGTAKLGADNSGSIDEKEVGVAPQEGQRGRLQLLGFGQQGALAGGQLHGVGHPPAAAVAGVEEEIVVAGDNAVEVTGQAGVGAFLSPARDLELGGGVEEFLLLRAYQRDGGGRTEMTGPEQHSGPSQQGATRQARLRRERCVLVPGSSHNNQGRTSSGRCFHRTLDEMRLPWFGCAEPAKGKQTLGQGYSAKPCWRRWCPESKRWVVLKYS